MRPLVQIARSGTCVRAGAEALRAAREQYARQQAVALPAFLEPYLVAHVQRAVSAAPFETRVHDQLDPPAIDLCMRPNATLGLLQFLTNDPRLFAFVERLTGCPPIARFLGTVYRMIPGAGHVDVWHSDASEDRLIGLSLNLSEAPYRGGVLTIKDWTSGRTVFEIANTGRGDAFLFRIDAGLKHRISAVEGRAPKTAFAGWFCTGPAYSTFLAEQVGRAPVAREG